MHQLATAFVLGYHGCDREVGEKLLSGEPFRKSENDYDWLGSGMYFWESNPKRALEFAEEKKNAPWGNSHIKEPYLIGAVINLGLCLDLTTSAGIQQVRDIYSIYERATKKAGYSLPKNSSEKYPLLRKLDCAVFNYLHRARSSKRKKRIDSVRGVFSEGAPVFDGAGFLEKTHIQICVCEPSNIKGLFRVPEDQLE